MRVVVLVALLVASCGYSEAEMQVQRDQVDLLRRAIAICEESGRDYLDKFEAQLHRCSTPAEPAADAGVKP